MKTVFYLAPVLFISVFLLILAEFRQHRKMIYIVKPISTFLVIVLAMLSFWLPTYDWTFSILVVLGLLFCLGGDVALMFQDNPKAFRIGLALFLLGHIVYSIDFYTFGVFSSWDVLTTLVLLIFGFGFYRLMRPNLGSMKIPVILYMVIISIMVNRALGLLLNPSVSHTQGLFVVLGALLFFVSDVVLAANRFWKPWRYHRISLAFYYAGQLLIALSTHYVG